MLKSITILMHFGKDSEVDNMPVRRTKSGGYKYGSKGKTYYDKGAKAKAARQGRAIKASQNRRRKK